MMKVLRGGPGVSGGSAAAVAAAARGGQGWKDPARRQMATMEGP